jgi:hypothetical protein
MAGCVKEILILKLYGTAGHRDRQVLIGMHLHEPCTENGLNSVVVMMMMIVSKLFENVTEFSYLGTTVTMQQICEN